MKNKFNYWVNEFGDSISMAEGYRDNRGYHSCYSVMINKEYQKSFGGLNGAKAYINKYRSAKCKFLGSKI